MITAKCVQTMITIMQLDEDEMSDFLAHSTRNCPYFRLYDEYKIVRKQN